jgi:hypothetical protein
MAKRKGYSFGGFWCLGFFSSFLIGIIAAAIVPVPAARPCPACGKPVAVGDLFCSACGSKMP